MERQQRDLSLTTVKQRPRGPWIAVDHQHHRTGRAVLADVKAHLATVDRDGDAIAGLVHPTVTEPRHGLSLTAATGLACPPVTT